MEECFSLITKMLQDKESITSEELQIPKEILHGALLSMESKNQIIFEIKEKYTKVLTEDGKDAVDNGTQEFRLFNAIQDEGNDVNILNEFPLGSNYAFKNRWIKIDNNKLYKLKDSVEDIIAKMLKDLSLVDDKKYSDLKKRKLVDQVKSNIYIIKKGPDFGKEQDFETELTSEIVLNYQNQQFKKYNFNSIGNVPNCGSLHPLLKIREEFKKIFIEMGFSEMRTNKYVESSFWNFDSLFQPQSHPARDAHDTFFLKNPELTHNFDEEYLEKVRNIHEKGGFGSIGHQSIWSKEEAMKNILRTHTTACSSRYLKNLAKDFKPVKLFSIDKVFRNESVDATHLAEFHQVEGVIAARNLTLGDLMGFMSTFFEKLGLKNIKFKPAFNPYTEPSMEVFGFHEGLNKWIEIGNSGVFRPEMLRPMGLDEDVTVLGWGLSLERPAMIKYGLNNIRDLVGHKVDINFIKKYSPNMIVFDPMLPEDILSLDLTNLDSKSENFSFAYYLEYLVKNPNDFFTIRSFDIYSKLVSDMIYTRPILAYLFAKKEYKEEICLHLSAISVAPAYRKFKLGTKLMKLFELNGNFINAHFSDLFVRSSNFVAINFYKKLGYKIYRTVYNYYLEPSENAFDMRKPLEKDYLKICEQKGKDIQSSELY